MEPFDRALDAFQEIFPDPESFGKPGGSAHGASDGSKGAQWNFWVIGTTGEAYLSINLEGMKYKNWPISTFILSELKEPQLLHLRTELGEFDPIIRFRRDAWQAQARISIAEADIGHVLPLSKFTADTWRATLAEALQCLDPSKFHKGRAKQHVTRLKDDQVIEMWVSPHLNILVKLWDETPSSHSTAYKRMASLVSGLTPIHDLVGSQSTRTDSSRPSSRKVKFDSLGDAANYALQFTRAGSSTHNYLQGLLLNSGTDSLGSYTVTPNRFVWWGEDGSRLARFELKSVKLSLVVANSQLEGVKLPTGAKPHIKNASMTDCFTDAEAEVAELLRVFERRSTTPTTSN